MNEAFYYDLQQSIERRCAWNSAGNCCQGIEHAYQAGAAAMRERCAEVAENTGVAYSDYMEGRAGEVIADTIRRLEI